MAGTFPFSRSTRLLTTIFSQISCMKKDKEIGLDFIVDKLTIIGGQGSLTDAEEKALSGIL